MWKTVITFLLFNFGCLFGGSQFTQSGVQSQWYSTLKKAPWTPPGWVFGAAWTFIMICFSFYMAILWTKNPLFKKQILTLFIATACLNVLWNPLFFTLQLTLVALICITLLTILIWFIGLKYYTTLKGYSFFILPYAIWLVIATSLNFYILLYN